eukprot:g2873.t1
MNDSQRMKKKRRDARRRHAEHLGPSQDGDGFSGNDERMNRSVERIDDSRFFIDLRWPKDVQEDKIEDDEQSKERQGDASSRLSFFPKTPSTVHAKRSDWYDSTQMAKALQLDDDDLLLPQRRQKAAPVDAAILEGRISRLQSAVKSLLLQRTELENSLEEAKRRAVSANLQTDKAWQETHSLRIQLRASKKECEELRATYRRECREINQLADLARTSREMQQETVTADSGGETIRQAVDYMRESYSEREKILVSQLKREAAESVKFEAEASHLRRELEDIHELVTRSKSSKEPDLHISEVYSPPIVRQDAAVHAPNSIDGTAEGGAEDHARAGDEEIDVKVQVLGNNNDATDLNSDIADIRRP